MTEERIGDNSSVRIFFNVDTITKKLYNKNEEYFVPKNLRFPDLAHGVLVAPT